MIQYKLMYDIILSAGTGSSKRALLLDIYDQMNGSQYLPLSKFFKVTLINNQIKFMMKEWQ